MTESKIPYQIHSLEDFSTYFLKNRNPDPKKDISYKNISFNTKAVRQLLRDTITSISKRESFFTALKKIDKRIDSLLRNREATKIMFHLTKVARHNFTFNEFCILISRFFRFNPYYRRSFDKAGLFKNLILKKRAGKNYPIESAPDLKLKFKTFYYTTRSLMFCYLDILDRASEDLKRKSITPSEYTHLVYLILKCSPRSFEYEICKRARESFLDIGDTRKEREFHELLRNH